MGRAKPYDEERWMNAMPSCYFLRFGDRQTWLEARRKFLCGSDTANVLGIGFRDNVSVWEDKTKVNSATKIQESAIELMEKGSEAEEHIREMWCIDNDIRDVYDGTGTLIVNRDILDSNGNAFMACTLDSWGNNGKDDFILEIKRSESPRQWGQFPPIKYRAQCLKQMIVTGIRYAYLVAYITFTSNEGKRSRYMREYLFDANDNDVKNDMGGIISDENRFWNEYVLKNKRPPKRIAEI